LEGFALTDSQGVQLEVNGNGRMDSKLLLETKTASRQYYLSSINSTHPPPTQSSLSPSHLFVPTIRGQDISSIGFTLSCVDAGGRYTDELIRQIQSSNCRHVEVL